ncbi:MAG: ATP-binding protein [Verrucomicrobia bacterium]|nr:ATP-binding protein [Pseudomonadota bacterium]NBS06621.1 ATP-binding protein [Verrucomicrobiota bacterium]NBS79359.1 ATP-binding protein [bacterium]NBS49663.1 ATP-binding protein [Verrucomicrobiota bacterium]NBV96728.1 ATP-binding protein [Verrucomicrobiota bacterium]
MKHPEVKVTVKNRIEDLLRVNSIFESFATQHDIGGRLRYHLLVSIEEILTNIIKYGFDEQGVHPIHITFRVVVDNVEMEFEDRGREFNPLEVEDPDLVSAIENRQLGGLGIHLVKKMVDAAEYRRVGDKNILLLRKSKSAPTPTS